MEVRVLGMHGGEVQESRSSCYLLDGHVLLDAGGGQALLSEGEADGIDGCIVTHAHLDHVYGLPLLLDRRYGCPTLEVRSIAPVIRTLTTHMFNDALWPDLTRIPDRASPFVRFVEVTPEVPVRVAGLEATPVEVSHSVPAVGWLVSLPGERPVVFSGDTGPTTRLWEMATARAARAAFVEVSYPDRLARIAALSGHLTPATLADAIGRLPPGIPIRLIHLKPELAAEIESELAPLLAAHGNIGIARAGATYRV